MNAYFPRFQSAVVVLSIKGMMACVIGLWLLYPGEKLSTSLPFAALATIFGSDLVVSLIMVVSGAGVLAAINRHWWGLARTCGVVIGGFFGLFAGAAFAAQPALLAVPVFCMLALLSFWSVIGIGKRRHI